MMNPTALTLMLALVVVGVLGGWLLLGLLLRIRRDNAVETVVLEHDRQHASDRSEQLLLDKIQRVRAESRERQILIGCSAVLVLLLTLVVYAVLHLAIALGGL